MRVGIDSSICSGHGRCYVLHPELFESDEEGFGRVIDVDTPELVARGANADHIFYELFDSAPVQCTELESADILFSRSKVRCRWNSEDDLSVLELAENAGVRVPSECRAGSCLSCRSRIIEGDMTSTMGDGSALLCIGRPKSPVLVLDC